MPESNQFFKYVSRVCREPSHCLEARILFRRSGRPFEYHLNILSDEISDLKNREFKSKIWRLLIKCGPDRTGLKPRSKTQNPPARVKSPPQIEIELSRSQEAS